MGYKTTVTEIGPLVSEFLGANLLIIFNDNAPDALREMAVLHTIEDFSDPVKVDDIIAFDGKEYLVTAVGGEANETLEKMGHCTFCFTGKDQAEIPGQIELIGEGLPEVKIGTVIEIMHL